MAWFQIRVVVVVVVIFVMRMTEVDGTNIMYHHAEPMEQASVVGTIVEQQPAKVDKEQMVELQTFFSPGCSSLCIHGSDTELNPQGLVSGIFSSGDVSCGALHHELTTRLRQQQQQQQQNVQCRFLQAAAWAAGTCGCPNPSRPLSPLYFPHCPLCNAKQANSILDPLAIAGRNLQDGSLLSCGQLQVLMEFGGTSDRQCQAHRTTAIQSRCCRHYYYDPHAATATPPPLPPSWTFPPPTPTPTNLPTNTPLSIPALETITLAPSSTQRAPTPPPPSSSSSLQSPSPSSWSSSPPSASPFLPTLSLPPSLSLSSSSSPTPRPFRFADECQDAPKDYPVQMLYRIKNEPQTCRDLKREPQETRDVVCQQMRNIRQLCPETCHNFEHCQQWDVCIDAPDETFGRPLVFIQTCPWLAKRNSRMQQSICQKSPDAQIKCPVTCHACNA